MKNKIKYILMFVMIAMVLIIPLQSSAFVTSNLDNNITAATKEPISKKKIAYKFIVAMLGVAASSVIIFVGLSAYNKLFKSRTPVVGLNNFKKSDSLKDAINTFIKKTDWY